MKNIKRLLAGSLAVICAFSAVGCGKEEKKKETESSSFVEQIKVEEVEGSSEIAALTGSESDNTLKWLSYFDLNPTKGAPEKRADLSLFEQKGGKIEYVRTSSLKKYDDLATKVLSEDVPDMFWFEQRMTFPCNVVAGMFQPVDEVVNFDDPLWADVKQSADMFTINGKHYVAPINFEVMSVLTYNQDFIDANGLDDPYSLYLEGNWDWNSFRSIMEDWVALGTEETPHIGVNGWLHTHIFASTGKTIVGYDEASQKFVSNLNDADLERAANFMYDITKNNLVNTEWIGEASTAFQRNILFYAMGQWASIDDHTPKEDDHWTVVPMPKDPNNNTYYQSTTPHTYMWVKGSTKKDAYKCWLECARSIYTEDTYYQVQKDKFFVSNPYYSEQNYDLVNEELLSNKFVQVYDMGCGLTPELSDDDHATTPTKEAIISYMYSSVSKVDEETQSQFTWTQLKSAYSGTIQSELDKFNASYAEFIKNNP